jgi:hypothetical protein
MAGISIQSDISYQPVFSPRTCSASPRVADNQHLHRDRAFRTSGIEPACMASGTGRRGHYRHDNSGNSLAYAEEYLYMSLRASPRLGTWNGRVAVNPPLFHTLCGNLISARFLLPHPNLRRIHPGHPNPHAILHDIGLNACRVAAGSTSHGRSRDKLRRVYLPISGFARDEVRHRLLVGKIQYPEMSPCVKAETSISPFVEGRRPIRINIGTNDRTCVRSVLGRFLSAQEVELFSFCGS